jgi:hypothetical protein
LLFRVDRNGRRIDYEYDSLHRIRSESWDWPIPSNTTRRPI